MSGNETEKVIRPQNATNEGIGGRILADAEISAIINNHVSPFRFRMHEQTINQWRK